MARFLGTIGKDTITGSRLKDTLYGEEGDDVLFGLAGADILSGDDGNDVLIGGLGSDTLHGGAGADAFRYANLAEIGDYEWIVDFAAGDQIDFSLLFYVPNSYRRFIGEEAFTGVAGEARYGRQGYGPMGTGQTMIEVDADGDGEADHVLWMNGTLHLAETLAGSGILVVAANKSLLGTANSETLSGGAGRDLLNGLTGDDSLVGGQGDDTLLGGLGRDTLVGGLGADELTGGLGTDSFVFASLEQMWGDRITDFAAGDRIDLSAVAGLRFIGDSGFGRRPGELRLSGGSLSYDSDGDGIADYGFSLALPGVRALSETAKGSGILMAAADRVLAGTAAGETLLGGAGWDTVSGLDGNDVLYGNGGNDSLNGGLGADVLLGGYGVDTLTGGAGNDSFRYASLAEIGGGPGSGVVGAGERITDFVAGDLLSFAAVSGITFIGTAAFGGVAGQVRYNTGDGTGTGGVFVTNATWLQFDIDGSGTTDLILQLDGRMALEETAAGSRILRVVQGRVINGTAADETLSGGLGNDTINGQDGKDSLSGGDGNDSLVGGAGGDTLAGGEGDDSLVGGAGADTLTGGAGANRFVFRPGDLGMGEARDVITDFQTYADKLDLSAIDANTTAGFAGDQAFTYYGGMAFMEGFAGLLRFEAGVLQGEVNGDGIADFEIALTGVGFLGSSEVIL